MSGITDDAWMAAANTHSVAMAEGMREPVTPEEIRLVEQAVLYRTPGHDGGTRGALECFLARRAAAPRAEVVVTEEMVNECHVAARHAYAGGYDKGIVSFSLNWLADRLNGKHEKPVDPNVEKLAAILRNAGMDSETANATAKRATVEFTAMLNARKP
jgi:hypothetical protein